MPTSGYHIDSPDPLGGPKLLMDMADGDCGFMNCATLLFDGLELWVDGRRGVYPKEEGDLAVQVWKADGIWYCRPWKGLLLHPMDTRGWMRPPYYRPLFIPDAVAAEMGIVLERKVDAPVIESKIES